MKRLFLVIGLMVIATPLTAELPFRHSDDFQNAALKQSYEGDAAPENDDPGLWHRKGESAFLSTEDGILRYQVAANSTLRWKAAWWDGEIADQKGFTIEVRLKLEAGGEFVVTVGTGKLIVRENSVAWGDKILASGADNTKRFHTFRIAKRTAGLGYDIWHNGEPIGELEKGSFEDETSFGSNAGGAEIDHVRWDTSGAYCP